MRRLLMLVTLPLLLDAVVAYALAGNAPPPNQAGDRYTVFFDWDQAALSQHARATLARAGRDAESGHVARIMLVDADGGGVRRRTYGAALARARLLNTTAELRRDGVERDRIAAEGASVVLLRPHPRRAGRS